MTDACQEWIGHCADNYPCSGPVLEVGSFDVNGNPRDHFKDRDRFPEYIGIDMRKGPCVDKVMNVGAMDFPDNSFGVIVDAERLEHDKRFWLSICEEFRVCKPGGYIIITTRSWGGFPPHDYPSDYWRFMDNGIRDLLEYAGFQCVATAYGESWAGGDRAVFAVGRKPLEGEQRADFSVVILSKNQSNLDACLRSIRDNEPSLPPDRIHVIADQTLFAISQDIPQHYVSEPFIFARNANLGIKTADSDVILLNDDARLTTSQGLTKLARHKAKGIVSAAIVGMVGNKNQHPQTEEEVRREPHMLCFVAVLIPKWVQAKVGTLDERFTEYGFEDNDYCRRAQEAGVGLSIFDGCVVEHGTLKPTFRSQPGWEQKLQKAQQIYQEKYTSPALKS